MYHNKIPSIAFAVESLEPSELIFRIMMDSMENKEFNCTIFWLKLSKAPASHLCSNMHIHEAYSYQEPVIATNLKTAQQLIRMPSPKPKFFFLNDLEWLRYPSKDHKTLASIYRNPELTILARCNDHKILIENCWNVKVDKVIPDYEFFEEDFLAYFKEKVWRSNKRIAPIINYKPIHSYF